MAKSPNRVPLRLKISAKIKAQIDRQVEARGYRDASAYVEACVANDPGVPSITSWDQLDGLLAEAVASGPARAMTSRDWVRLARAATGAPTTKSAPRARRRSA